MGPAMALLLGFVLVACGGNDVSDAGDVAADVTELADTPDAAVGDTPSDTVDPDAPQPPCTYDQVPKGPADSTRTKFALSMFHWNTQYVAGGLISTWDGAPITACGINFGDDSMCEGWTDDALVDWIILQSFEPVLDMYLSNPTWGTTFECPGIMIEAMAARHPEVLLKLRAGVQSGQIELVSFHWSAQLFLAYPARDLEKSLAINDEILQANCLPVSPVVFNQEGMSGVGKHAFMAEHGFTIDVLHENMFRYFQWGTAPWPLYKSRGVTVIAGMEEGLKDGPSVDPASGIQVVWPFFDDGEVLATIGSPYLAPVMNADPAAVTAYEALIQSWVDQGYTVSTIAAYVRDLTARDITVRDLPPITDSTWQPVDTKGIQQWMGRHGSLDATWVYERDNDERTATYRTSQAIAVAEVLFATADAAGKNVAATRSALDGAWRDLLKAQVSDATGINPWPGEFTYGMTFNDAAATVVAQATTDLLASLGWPHANIDVGTGTATRLDDIPVAEAPAPTEAPFAVSVTAPTRTLDVRWYEAGANHVRMVVTFGPMADPTSTAEPLDRRVTVAFPRYDDILRYTPGLSDREVLEQPLSGFTLQADKDDALVHNVYLPLPNGLIGLGDNWWVIKHCATVHLAAVVNQAEGEARSITFVDETAIPGESRTWEFSVFQGSTADALALANRLNSFPVVTR
jgi:hypothetical protein